MTVNDVDLVMQPLAPGFVTPPSDADKRLTFQHFSNPGTVTMRIAPHNSDARLSDSDDWPPPFIFDVTYGCAALNTWGLLSFVDFARKHTRPIYYNDEDENGENGGGDSGSEARKARKLEREQIRNVGQQGSRADFDPPDGFDMILGLWTYNARKVKPQERAMEASSTLEKVGAWLDSVR